MRSTFDQIRTALASAYPITVLVSPEEDRQENLLKRFGAAAKPDPLPVVVWNCVDGFVNQKSENHRDPMQALAWIASDAPRGLYLLKDFDGMLDDRLLRRRLRDTAMKIRNSGRFLFLLQQNAELPDSIKPLSYIVVSLFPDDGEIKSLVTGLLSQRVQAVDNFDRLVASLKGMSLTEAEHLLRRLLDRHTDFTEEFFREVLAEKEQITRKEGILEFVPPDASLAALGGLDQLKEWVSERNALFQPEARAQGLPRPRGVLLMGISGCGKSLAVKITPRGRGRPCARASGWNNALRSETHSLS